MLVAGSEVALYSLRSRCVAAPSWFMAELFGFNTEASFFLGCGVFTDCDLTESCTW